MHCSVHDLVVAWHVSLVYSRSRATREGAKIIDCPDHKVANITDRNVVPVCGESSHFAAFTGFDRDKFCLYKTDPFAMPLRFLKSFAREQMSFYDIKLRRVVFW